METGHLSSSMVVVSYHSQHELAGIPKKLMTKPSHQWSKGQRFQTIHLLNGTKIHVRSSARVGKPVCPGSCRSSAQDVDVLDAFCGHGRSISEGFRHCLRWKGHQVRDAADS
jgi:hypothetical protein